MVEILLRAGGPRRGILHPALAIGRGPLVHDCPPAQRERGAKPVIPNVSNRKLPFSFDKKSCGLRHRIENAFSRLKDFRRIATRMRRVVAGLPKRPDHPQTDTHVCEKAHRSADHLLLGEPGGILQRLGHVLARQIGIVGNDLRHSLTVRNLRDDDGHRNPHPANAGTAARDLGAKVIRWSIAAPPAGFRTGMVARKDQGNGVCHAKADSCGGLPGRSPDAYRSLQNMSLDREDAMKFGLFYEISIPRPWTPEREREVYNNCLEQVKLADQLGFSNVWAVEHHFLEEYSHCSAPELFLTACAMVTKNIRVGHGIVVCVPEFNHPIKIAEKTATLDLLSGGRLEVGTGRSATWTELGGFRANPDTTKKSWDEFVRCLPKMWTQETFAYQGEFWSMPERTILPKPYQKPHPPMWVAVTSPGTEIDAADRGMGSLGLSFAGYAEQEKKIKEYRRRIQLCEPVGSFVNEQVATTNFLFCHEDEKTGIDTGKRLGNTFNYLATQLISTREVFSSPSYQSLGLLPALRRAATGPDASEQQTEGMAYGDPARIIRAIKHWESLGVDCVNFILNANETIPQEQVMASLRLFAKEVMPVFAQKPAGVAAAE
jgi:alkanesulfonate monooxygenase SsuD/methylene tetrahydromethanopterin reductase-like flavin-dependent oxidoreductase (luciferase family)